MDWQTIVVFCFVTLATAFLAVRGWRIAGKQRARCQSKCGGCARGELVQLVGERVE